MFFDTTICVRDGSGILFLFLSLDGAGDDKNKKRYSVQPVKTPKN